MFNLGQGMDDSRRPPRPSIRVGLTKCLRLVHGMRRKLSVEKRDRIADAIHEQLETGELANWKVELGCPIQQPRRPLSRP